MSKIYYFYLVLKSECIKQLAHAKGFVRCGIARVRPLDEQADRLMGWLSKGYGGGLEYMARDPMRRVDLHTLLPEARSVIVCAMAYPNRSALTRQAWERDGTPRVASFAQLPEDYHVTMKRKLHSMLAALGVEGKCFVDTAPLLEKAWAVEAGLGWVGRNSLLIVPRVGSFVILGEIVVDQPIDAYDEPFAREHCGRCRRCEEACPTGAILPGERMIDAGRCVSRLTFERRRLEPDAPAEVFAGGWTYGCDGCSEACPYNK